MGSVGIGQLQGRQIDGQKEKSFLKRKILLSDFELSKERRLSQFVPREPVGLCYPPLLCPVVGAPTLSIWSTNLQGNNPNTRKVLYL